MGMNEERKSPETIKEVGVLLEDIAGQVSAVAEGVLSNSERLERFEKSVNKRFDAVDKRFDRIEGRLAKIEAEVTAIREILGTSDAPNIITRDEYSRLDERLRKIEEQLKLTPA